jgi:hypothetical protein
MCILYSTGDTILYAVYLRDGKYTCTGVEQ